MRADRFIQIGALVVAAAAFTGAGLLLPGMLKQSEDHGLRYTDVSVEGAPPFVALGTAIGAMRGLIVDYLWIKVNLMKQQGLYYEVMADADLITKLQPRFAPVFRRMPLWALLASGAFLDRAVQAALGSSLSGVSRSLEEPPRLPWRHRPIAPAAFVDATRRTRPALRAGLPRLLRRDGTSK